MEIGQSAIKSVNLTLRPWSLQRIWFQSHQQAKYCSADVQFDRMLGSDGSRTWEILISPLWNPIQLITQWRPQSEKISWLMLEQCWRHVSAVKEAVFKPTVLAERLVEEQEDVFEMWGVLSSSESHFFFLHSYEAVANAVVFVKWGSDDF